MLINVGQNPAGVFGKTALLVLFDPRGGVLTLSDLHMAAKKGTVTEGVFVQGVGLTD